MSQVWPLDVGSKLNRGPTEPLRPFKCLLLMPFESRFDKVADVVRSTVLEVFAEFRNFPFEELPHIKRLDWVTSSGVIQSEIWDEVRGADLVFCDVTGYNANVMFEAGVCAAWKRMEQVVFVRDHFYKGQSPFDLAPIRYTEYELTGDGIATFKQKLHRLTFGAMSAFPDAQGVPSPVRMPLKMDFREGHDDLRLYTPPFAHRRLLNDALEFGSLSFFSHSWASLGKGSFLNLDLRFTARFANPHPDAYIGVGLRSQHFFANFGHIIYLKQDGAIVMTRPDETPPNFYTDLMLRQATKIDVVRDHVFQIRFDRKTLRVKVDDFEATFQVAKMPKVFGPGLIRFQCFRCWMALVEVTLSEPKSGVPKRDQE